MLTVSTCLSCGKSLEGKRKGAKTCSAVCRVALNRNEVKEFHAKPEKEKMSELEIRLGFKIDRTRAFTEEEQSKVNQLSTHLRYAAMARDGSAEGFGDNHGMSEEERFKHYRSENYPQVRYHSSGGGGYGSVEPK